VVKGADVLLLGTKAVDHQSLQTLLQPRHTVIDLVNLNPAQRPQGQFRYQGICW
jgi:hypothetical protein